MSPEAKVQTLFVAPQRDCPSRGFRPPRLGVSVHGGRGRGIVPSFPQAAGMPIRAHAAPSGLANAKRALQDVKNGQIERTGVRRGHQILLRPLQDLKNGQIDRKSV